jgi:hypothetical protein
MRSRTNHLQLASAIAVVSALILSACQPTDQSAVMKYANGGRKSEVFEASARTRATVTPELKAMLTDITTGDTYTQGMGPILAALTKSSKFPFEVFIKMKPWYVGNINLNQLPVKPLSSYSTTENKTLTSSQSLYEVWINLNALNRLTEEQKAELLVLEYLTSIYLFKNISSSEICSMATKADKQIADCREEAASQDQEALEEWEATQGGLQAPPTESTGSTNAAGGNKRTMQQRIDALKRKTPKPYTGKIAFLKKADYENIEAVKKYLATDKPTVEGLKEVMLNHGFPTRIFTLIKLK